ncbi:MAG: hypothetical protein H6733_17425 [Alphaproteobacteria bacterium]|nr:hypothetical protein [Alphaproteobacteria bacterium]
MRNLAFVAGLCLSACSVSVVQPASVIIENRTGNQIWFFSIAACGSSTWNEVLGADEYLADGTDLESPDLDPGCFDVYVEDELGCAAEVDGVDVEGGTSWVWTVRAVDLTCP